MVTRKILDSGVATDSTEISRKSRRQEEARKGSFLFSTSHVGYGDVACGSYGGNSLAPTYDSSDDESLYEYERQTYVPWGVKDHMHGRNHGFRANYDRDSPVADQNDPWKAPQPNTNPWNAPKPNTNPWSAQKPNTDPWRVSKPTTDPWRASKPTTSPWGAPRPSTDPPDSSPGACTCIFWLIILCFVLSCLQQK